MAKQKSIYSDDSHLLKDRLKRARQEARLSQEAVAEKLGYQQPYVSKVEAGQIRVDVVMLKKFAKLYGKNITYFLK